MVGKNKKEFEDVDDESLACVKLIAEKKSQLEETAETISQDITSCFERLIIALRNRERQLLRQVEAVHRQQLALVQSNSDLLPANAKLGIDLKAESDLIRILQDFGRIDLTNSIPVKDFEPYRPEEYQEAGEDVVSFDKSLKSEADEFDVSSVIRRKRDSRGNISSNVVINFNCTSCDDDVIVNKNSSSSTSNNNVNDVTTSSKKDEDQATSSSLFVENDSDLEESSVEEEENKGSTICYKNDDSKVTSSTVEKILIHDKVSSEKIDNTTAIIALMNDKTKERIIDDNDQQHPVQIQHWLRQILAETETEPIVNETGRPIVNASRFYRDFPVET